MAYLKGGYILDPNLCTISDKSEQLASTGASGGTVTLILIAAAIVMLAGVAVLLFKKKKMSSLSALAVIAIVTGSMFIGAGAGTPAFAATMDGNTPISQKCSTVVVHFVDEDGNPVASSVALGAQPIGTAYTTTPAVVDGYEVLTVPANASGQYVAGETTVTYVYRKKPPVVKGTVVVHYVDEAGNPIAPSDALGEEPVGTPYSTTPAVVTGYAVLTVPANATGVYVAGETIVTYIYRPELIPCIPDLTC